MTPTTPTSTHSLVPFPSLLCSSDNRRLLGRCGTRGQISDGDGNYFVRRHSESTEAARSDEMSEDTVSLTEVELRCIVSDDRYRDLVGELLPRYSDSRGEVGNSSGYQESSTSDLSDTDSSSGTEDRGDCLSSSKTNC